MKIPSQYFEMLWSSTVFQGVNIKQNKFLISGLKYHKYKKGEWIYQENDVAENFFFICHGRVQSSTHRYYHSHDFFGETSLFTSLPRNSSARALSDVELITISYNGFKRLTQHAPDLPWNFLIHLGQKLDTLEKTEQKKRTRLIAIHPSQDLKKQAFLAMEIALQLKQQFQKKVLIMDLNIQEISISELLKLQKPYDYFVINLPAKNPALLKLILHYADSVLVFENEMNQVLGTQARLIPVKPDWMGSHKEWYLGHLARRAAQKTVGIALSSGTGMALAHYAVLSELEKAGIPIDLIAGTSGGALFGSIFSLGVTETTLKASIHKSQSLFSKFLLSFAFSRWGLISFEKMISYIFPPLFGKNFKHLRYPLLITGTNLSTGQAVYYSHGQLIEALKVSTAIPFLFKAHIKNKHVLSDGCLVEPIPVKVLRKHELDIVLAIDVTQKKANREKIKNMMDVYLQSSNLTNYLMGQSALRNADLAISIPPCNKGYFDYQKYETVKKVVIKKMKQVIPEIKKLLR